MRLARVLSAAAVVLLLAVAPDASSRPSSPVPASSPESAAAARARAADILAHGPYQTEIPELQWRRDSVLTGSLSPGIAKLVEAALWLAGLLVVAAIAVGFIRSAAGRRRRATPEPDAESPTPRQAPAPAAVATIGDADRLAAAGDFREATHVLLLVAISACARWTATTVQVSATSRELCASLPLAATLRMRFADLVDAVERALFARHPVAADDYARCRGFCEEILAGPRP